MKVSLSWLKEYVSVGMPVPELAHVLTMAGLEVDAVSDRYEHLKEVVVGRITAVRPHPNADKLRLCDVDAGGENTLHIVCGAPNVFEGMVAPLALPGFLLPNGSALKKGKIRGERSEGMLCSGTELGLDADASGIMQLDDSLVPGTPLLTAMDLEDWTIEIDLTPNRPDCLSLIGTAREIAANRKASITYPDFALAEEGNEIDALTSVTIEDAELCPRYAARMLVDVKVGPSPFWLQDRLLSVGLTPINNIVDVTNFVMMETGQPLHAFDFDRLEEGRIVVRTAKEGEKFTTLDDKERTLSAETLMICDGKKPVAVAGVMGGQNSEIEEGSTRVLIESAYFKPESVRKTSKRLTLHTDATHRFERGVDPEGTVNALNRAAKLMAEVSGATMVPGLIDNHPNPKEREAIILGVHETNRLLGLSLTAGQIADCLVAVEFEVEITDEKTLRVMPPSFRVDVERPEDLMEEVARMTGYNNIPTTYPMVPAIARTQPKEIGARAEVRQLMTGFGYTEAINYSFIHEASADRLNLPEADFRRKSVAIMNPLTEEQGVLRTSLVPGLLETMHRNLSQQNRDLKLFEVGKTFIGTEGGAQPDEIEILAGLVTGSRGPASWQAAKEEKADFFDLKGAVEALFDGLLLDDVAYTLMPAERCIYTKQGHTAEITVSGVSVGQIGEVHPAVLKNFDLKQTAFIFEIDMDRLIPMTGKEKIAGPIPKFPAITRDNTLIVDGAIPAMEILAAVEKVGEKLLESARLVDVYEGEKLPEGKRSVTVRFTYRSPDKTLKDKKVNGIHDKITKMLLKTFDASLPV